MLFFVTSLVAVKARAAYPTAMATNCGKCQAQVIADGLGLRVGHDLHPHFSGTCRDCGSRVQSHRMVIGFAGETPLMGAVRVCPKRCRYPDPAEVGPSRFLIVSLLGLHRDAGVRNFAGIATARRK